MEPTPKRTEDLSPEERREREQIRLMLFRTDNNQTQVARLLGVSVKTVQRKVTKYQLRN